MKGTAVYKKNIQEPSEPIKVRNDKKVAHPALIIIHPYLLVAQISKEGKVHGKGAIKISPNAPEAKFEILNFKYGM